MPFLSLLKCFGIYLNAVSLGLTSPMLMINFIEFSYIKKIKFEECLHINPFRDLNPLEASVSFVWSFCFVATPVVLLGYS